MKTNLLAVFLFFAFLYTNAQKFELGKVSIAELQEKVHQKDSSAAAAILFKKGEVQFEYTQEHGFEMVTTVKTRIKFYKKEGYEWANQSVAYYIGNSSRDKVIFSGANTFNLVDGKIVKTKLKSDGEFDEIINKYWGRKKIAMPNVKEGSVIEYEYTHRTSRFVELKEWYFQSSIPVNYSEFITYIPEYYVYKPNQKGFIFPKVTVEKNQKAIFINNVERASGGGFSRPTATFSQDKIDYQETKTAYLAENLPAMKDEAFVNNIDNYTTSVSHELSMTKFPYSTIEMYATDWESVTKKIYDNDDFGIELNKTGYFEEDVKLLLKGLTGPEDKILAIFDFVKSKVKWNDFYGYSCNDGVKKAYKDNVGNVAEINLMLTAMLRYAGLNANPVIISTRSNGIALFPSRAAFDYVISAVEINNGLVLLDATEKYSLPNILPIRDLNWSGRLIRKDGTSTEVDLMPKNASSNSINMNYAIDEKGGVSGKIRRHKTDYEALVFRTVNNGIKEESYLEKLENENEKIEISDYSRTNEKDIKLPVIENLSFSGSSFSEIISGKIYVNPLLFFAFKQNPFKQEIREYPVDYEYPFLKKYSINVQIPEGYKVETLPKSAAFTMEDNLGSFKFLVNNTENGIQLSVVEQINTAIIPSDYYSMLKDFYQEIVKKETEKIVLVKI
jgi:transglutaminase-like putative cysteine protease